MSFTVCKDCVPPERHIGCHSNCEKYLNEKAEYNKKKEHIKKIKSQEHELNMICMCGNKRKRA